MTTFTTDKQEAATSLGAADLDAGPQKVLPDLSPSRLCARAIVEGYAETSLEGATYLEIARQPGANLVAQAAAFLQTSFASVALASPAPVEALAQNAGLQNITSGTMNLADFESDGLGTYDFVTAVDVFATAATAERMALLVLVKKHLSESGIACIGIDVSPGWDLIDNLRTRFCADLDQRASAKERVDIVRTRVTNLAKTLAADKSGEQRALQNELVRLARASDAEIYRDLLDPNHQAMPIAAFLAMADAARLKPIGDIDPTKSNLSRIPSASRPLDASALGAAELYSLIDKHTLTKRRHVLLVHADRPEQKGDLDAAFKSLCFTSDLVRGDGSLSDTALLSGPPVTFVGPLKYKTDNLVEIAALALMERHRYFPVRGDHLIDHVVTALKPAGIQSADRSAVARIIRSVVTKLLPAGAIVAHMEENRAVSRVSERPVIAPLALSQARDGASHLASLLPHSIAVDNTARFILGRLDGTQTVVQIADELAAAVAKGELSLAAVEGTPEARAKATTMRVLGHAARSGLLVS